MRLRQAPVALLLALVMLAGAAGAAWAQSAYLAGIYDSKGTNPDGSGYTGTAIIEHHAGLLSVEWNINGERFLGFGKVSKSQLLVNWGEQNLVIYDITDGGRVLRGSWGGGRGTDVLTRR